MTGPAGATGATGPPGINTIALPDGSVGSFTWYEIGTLATAQGGRMFKMEVVTQDYYSASSGYIATAELILSTSDGTSFTTGFGSPAGNFLGTATVSSHCPLQVGWNRECFAIQQNSSTSPGTSYTFYMFLLNAPGRGMFRVTTNTLDTFTYTGVPSFMSGKPGSSPIRTAE